MWSKHESATTAAGDDDEARAEGETPEVQQQSSVWDQSPGPALLQLLFHGVTQLYVLLLKVKKKSLRTDNRNDFLQLREFLYFSSIKHFVQTVMKLDINLKYF